MSHKGSRALTAVTAAIIALALCVGASATVALADATHNAVAYEGSETGDATPGSGTDGSSAGDETGDVATARGHQKAGEGNLAQTGAVPDNTVPIILSATICAVAAAEFVHMRRKMRRIE